MIKYYNIEVVFEEIPDEVTLAVNITNCQHNCPGCHSQYLREDIGKELNFKAIDKLIEKNDGITCFCFMGEGNDPKSLKDDILHIKEKYPSIADIQAIDSSKYTCDQIALLFARQLIKRLKAY